MKNIPRQRRFAVATLDLRRTAKIARWGMRYAPVALVVVCAVLAADMHSARAGVLDQSYKIPSPEQIAEHNRIFRERAIRLERQDDTGSAIGLLAVAALYALKNTILATQVIWHGIGPVH